MIILGVIEFRGRDNLGRNLPVTRLRERALVTFQRLPRGFFLLFRTGINPGTVLGTDIIPLAHTLGGIMRLPEFRQ